MVKNIILVFVLLNSLIACSYPPNEDIDDFMEELEGLTLEEAIEHIRIELIRFQIHSEFNSNFSSIFSTKTDTKVYTKDEESYSDLPKFPSPEEIESSYMEYFPQLILEQEFDYPTTYVQVKADEPGVITPRGFEFKLKEIYYSDGTIDNTEKTFSRKLSLTPAKAIDSIRVMGCYSYYTDYDSYKVKDKLDIPGGKIEINRIKGNSVEIETTGTARYYKEIIALNEEDKVLSILSSSSSEKDGDKAIKLYAAAYTKFLKKAESFKSVEELKNSFRKMLMKLPTFFTENPFIYTGHFQGNVHSVIVYIPQERIDKEVELMVVNTENYPALIFASDHETGKSGFINKSGEFIMPPVYSDLFQLNNFYYYTEDDSDDEFTLYYLDIEKQALREIPDIEHVEWISADCISVLKDDKYALWNADGKNVTGFIYDYISSFEGTEMLFVRKDDRSGFINSSGQIILPVIYSNFDYFSEGYAVIYTQSGEKKLIDKQGKFILDLSRYDEVKKVSDGLLAVCKNGLWGFIDIKGKVIIPLIYHRVNDFSYGVTLVEKDGYGLINKEGDIIVPLTKGSFSINTRNNKRTYRLGRNQYDHYGRKISGDRE